MSVWTSYANGPAPPPGTPNIEVRRATTDTVNVLVGGAHAYGPVDYQQARLWVQNTYHLTSTMYLAIHEDYERVAARDIVPFPENSVAPVSDAPNKYRKPGAPSAGSRAPVTAQ